MASGMIRHQRISEQKLKDSRRLRKNMTRAEAILWERLRDRRCGGFKFRRQQIIGGFIADFFCEGSKLAIEVDGEIHELAEKKKDDAQKEVCFGSRGIMTVRFKNSEVETNIEPVVEKIAGLCSTRKCFNSGPESGKGCL